MVLVGSNRGAPCPGTWIWGTPVEMVIDGGEKVSVLDIDTEGSASVEKSNVYDDS
ncbi:guanylate-binding protein 4 isoform X2 [Iris pallida]|uniref:Guanylate-binding protein 4 isoform X2 n=1 Tax=Iris pallida TaxID=29817 RepID=A0AAX6EPN0_IRIPA|nr:guanylate-binding protein 4 isoform X2 [Iris pallida]KAJ6829921.1 guanylate-binding protein 4 isoform X2 [Iris pallida]